MHEKQFNNVYALHVHTNLLFVLSFISFLSSCLNNKLITLQLLLQFYAESTCISHTCTEVISLV